MFLDLSIYKDTEYKETNIKFSLQKITSKILKQLEFFEEIF